ncbi:hypothetical protein JW964_08415 [candidate division KSB1 bacterium]|nr:hypothetical protein [candidate division KSB1 bacterium]
MDEKKRREFLRTLRELEKSMKEYRKYEKQLARFTKDLLERVSNLTWDYFSKPVPDAGLIEQMELTEVVFRKRFIANSEFEYFGNLIFDQLCDDMEDFSGDEVPPERKLEYQKIEYPSYSKEECEQNALEFSKKYNLTLPEHLESLRQSFMEEAISKKYYDTYEILLHKELKKMTVEYFPEIMEISGTGLREIDYMLYKYTSYIQNEIMEVIYKKE